MKMRLSPAMRRATELFRNGELSAAAEALRSSFGTAPLQPAPVAEPRHAGSEAEPAAPRRSLGETLAELAARMPVHGLQVPAPEEPELPEGARFEAGSFACAAGERAYRLYVPGRAGVPRGLIVMLHGCTQSPVDFAKGTGMNRLAEEQGLLVLYPEQTRAANLKACWNWFSPEDQARDSGEPAILAGMTRELRDRHQVPAGRVFVAGLSAGAAMAVILGRSYPEIFAAVGAHSGLPYKAASGASAAFAAMGGSRPGRRRRPRPWCRISCSTAAPIPPSRRSMANASPRRGVSPGSICRTRARPAGGVFAAAACSAGTAPRGWNTGASTARPCLVGRASLGQLHRSRRAGCQRRDAALLSRPAGGLTPGRRRANPSAFDGRAQPAADPGATEARPDTRCSGTGRPSC